MKLRLMLDSQCRQVRVRGQIPGGPGDTKKAGQTLGVLFGRMDDADIRLGQLCVDPGQRVFEGHRTWRRSRVRGDADESQQRDPGKSDHLCAG